MAFCLLLETIENKVYIHKSFNLSNPSSPKTSKNNMNLAMLFSSESSAKKFRNDNNIPSDFLVSFIPIRMDDSSDKKSYHPKIDRGNSIDDELPDFLR